MTSPNLFTPARLLIEDTMIVLKIEMWPRGEEARAYPLGSARIWNNATGTASIGNYGFKLFRKDGRQYKEGVITKFPRKRLLVWDLLFRILHLQFAERNKAGHRGEGSAIASETQIASDHGALVSCL
jgi:hypothetical protein